MSTLLKRFTSNAGANIVGGVGTAIYNIVLPSLVVHKLGVEEFSVWTLGLQVMIYVQVLGFGIQTALARFIAADNECGNARSLYLTTIVGKNLSKTMMGIGFVASIILAIVYPLFFNKLSSEYIIVLRYCVLSFGISASIQLLTLLPIGFFTGIHKNYIHVGSQLVGRVLSLLIIYLLVKIETNIKVLSIGLSLSLLIPVILVTIFFRKKMVTNVLISYSITEYQERKREMISYCKVLAIWSICMLFVNGIQPSVVGLFDIVQVGNYSLALTLVMVMVGLQQALMSPIITAGSTLHSSNNIHGLYKLFSIATITCCLVLFFSVIIFFLFGKLIIKIWVGESHEQFVYPILLALSIANFIRNILSPYSLLLIATGTHKKAHVSAIVEGVASLVMMLTMGFFKGAIGVAQGTIIASVIGVYCNVFMTFKNISFLKGKVEKTILIYVSLPIIVILILYFLFIGWTADV